MNDDVISFEEIIPPHLTSDDKFEFNLNMDEKLKLNKFKYSEDTILKELKDYITGTYSQHYSAGDDKVQTLDLIEACGDGESFCRNYRRRIFKRFCYLRPQSVSQWFEYIQYSRIGFY